MYLLLVSVSEYDALRSWEIDCSATHLFDSHFICQADCDFYVSVLVMVTYRLPWLDLFVAISVAAAEFTKLPKPANFIVSNTSIPHFLTITEEYHIIIILFKSP